MITTRRFVGVAGATLAVAGCALTGCSAAPVADKTGGFDFGEHLVQDGKADMIRKARIVEDVALNNSVRGTFERRIRVYGFTFEAKAGAIVDVDIAAFAGEGAFGIEPGSALDTVATLYGPMRGEELGERLAYSDDTESSFVADLPAVEIVEDGRYLVAVSSWDDPGDQGWYELTTDCEGTNFQCRRPVVDHPCREGTDYIVGGTTVGTETWDRCEVVLLEETRVGEGEILTIRPGVEVKGNFIDDGTEYGSVSLVVDGTLQAVGTADNPIRFASLRERWKGLVLNGDSNTLEHVYVEQAFRGAELNGSNNTVTHLNVNQGETGLYFGPGSEGTVVSDVVLNEVRTGIHFEEAAATIEDSVITGRFDGTGAGVRGDQGGPSNFLRTLVAGFGDAMLLDGMELAVYDGMIIENTRGVTVTGENAGYPTMEWSCPSWPAGTSNPRVGSWPPRPATWGRDPIFVRCDFRNNESFAVRILAPELLIIEDSNIIGNGAGVLVEAHALHDESRIIRSNVFGNGEEATQVSAGHVTGTLEISGNYWSHISDPELSSSWDTSHSLTRRNACTRSSWPSSDSCRWNGSNYTCGSWTCDSSGRNCRATGTTQWESEVRFTGFSPVELPAGPDLDACTDTVVRAREEMLMR